LGLAVGWLSGALMKCAESSSCCCRARQRWREKESSSSGGIEEWSLIVGFVIYVGCILCVEFIMGGEGKKVGCVGRPTRTPSPGVGCCYPRTEPQGGLFRALFPAFGGLPLIIPRAVRASAQPPLGPAALRWAAEPLHPPGCAPTTPHRAIHPTSCDSRGCLGSQSVATPTSRIPSPLDTKAKCPTQRQRRGARDDTPQPWDAAPSCSIISDGVCGAGLMGRVAEASWGM